MSYKMICSLALLISATVIYASHGPQDDFENNAYALWGGTVV